MPYNQSWLDLEKQLGGRMTLNGTPEEIKQQAQASEQVLSTLLPPPSDAVLVRDGQAKDVRYRTYSRRSKPFENPGWPIGIWAHGGGLMIGNLDTDDHLCRVVVEHIPCILISVDYRLSPENKVPAHLEDMLTVCIWAHRNAQEFGGDPNRIFTIGVSAGGSLALQVANYFAADHSNENIIKAVMAMGPFTLHPDHVPAEYESSYKSFKENETEVPMIDKRSMMTFYKHANALPNDARTFVALDTENHARFPPTCLVSCEYDPLRDDAFVMESALKKAGVLVRHDHYKGLPHCFWVFPILPETKTFENNLVDRIQWLIANMRDVSGVKGS